MSSDAVFCSNQNTAYEVRISDCSSDVCSSDLTGRRAAPDGAARLPAQLRSAHAALVPEGTGNRRRRSYRSLCLQHDGCAWPDLCPAQLAGGDRERVCRERVCQSEAISMSAVSLKRKISKDDHRHITTKQ